MESMNKVIASLKMEISDLRNTMKDNLKYIEILSSQVLITSHVTEKLRNELDRLDQYSMRFSLVIRGIPAKPRESVADVGKKVKEVIMQMDLSDAASDVDKAHRIGPMIDNKAISNCEVQISLEKIRSL